MGAGSLSEADTLPSPLQHSNMLARFQPTYGRDFSFWKASALDIICQAVKTGRLVSGLGGATFQAVRRGFRKLGGPYFGVLMVSILLFGVLYPQTLNRFCAAALLLLQLRPLLLLNFFFASSPPLVVVVVVVV